MQPVLLIDFGSTYTKLTAVDLDEPRLLGTASALTTVQTGLSHGLAEALQALRRQTGELRFTQRLACSSAAGGLRMAAIGLVPELTVEAAKRAALGAGARLLAAFGYKLNEAEIGRLEELRPDLILLAGGTDGGNEEVIKANAALLAAADLAAPIIVAGNKTVSGGLAEELQAAGKEAVAVANVLPELGQVVIEPAQAEIRRLFLARIIRAKGLAEVEREIDGILMPTPAAVLLAAELLAKGPAESRPGWGELLVVDVGGATTDVHSLAAGAPSRPDMYWRGLPEPFAKRTVEGDLGMRYSAGALVEAYGLAAVAALAGLSEAEVEAGIEARTADVSFLPAAPAEIRLDQILGYLAVALAVKRHAGMLETHYTPFGVAYVLHGKDLTPVRNVIGTGGVLLKSNDPSAILRGAAFTQAEPEILRPMQPRYYLDKDYIFPAMGLLAQTAPEAAFKLLQAHLPACDGQQSGA